MSEAHAVIANRSRLFWLGVLALFTAASSAAIRAAIAGDLKAEWIDPVAPVHAGELIGTALGSVLIGAIAAGADFTVALLVAAGITLATLPLTLVGRRVAR